MGTTDMYGLRFPDPSEGPDGPLAFQNLAEDIEGTFGSPAGSTVYDTGWISTGFTPAAGVTVSYQRFRRIGNIVSVYVSFSGASVSTPVSGNCANTNIGVVPTGFVPAQSQGGLGAGSAGRGAWATIDTSGNIAIVATVADSTATGTVNLTDISTLSGTYFMG